MSGGMDQGGSILGATPYGRTVLYGARDCGMVANASATAAEAALNSAALDTLISRQVAHTGTDGRVTKAFVEEGIYMVNNAAIVRSGMNLEGAGRGKTILRVHPDYLPNGPVLSNNGVLVEDVRIADIEIDGNYENNTNFAIRLTSTADMPFVTSGTEGRLEGEGGPDMDLPSGTFTVTGEIPASGGSLLYASYTGNNSGYILYESATGTAGVQPGYVTGAVTLTTISYVYQSNSTPVDVPSGTVFRFYGNTTTELIRISGYRRLWMDRLYVHDSGSQNFQAGGHPYNTGVLEKEDLYITRCEFKNSYNSDNVDIKASGRTTIIHTVTSGANDKGLNVRGPMIWVIGGDNSYGHCGATFCCTSAVDPVPAQALAADITDAVGQTVTVATKVQPNWPTASHEVVLGGTEIADGTRAGSTWTAVTRGKYGTRAQPWLQFSSGHGNQLAAIIADVHTEMSLAQDADVAVIGGRYSYNNGNGLQITGSGSGTIRAHVADVQANYNRVSGISARATKGRVEMTISGASVRRNGFNYPYSGGTGDSLANASPGIDLANLMSATIVAPQIARGGGDGIEAIDMGNGLNLVAPEIWGNAGYAVDLGSTGTSSLHCDGRLDVRGNTLGALRYPPGARLTGSALGKHTSRFRPMVFQHTADPDTEGNARLAMMTGVLFGATFTGEGAIGMRTLAKFTELVGTSTTLSKMAIGTITDAGAFTVLAATGSGTGASSLFGTIAQTLNNLAASAVVWPDLGQRYVLLALNVGSNTPRIAAYLPPRISDTATWAPMRSGYLVGQTDIPTTGTLVRTASLTSGVTVVDDETVTVTSTAGIVLGQTIVHANVPTGATVASITDATHFELSEPATAAGTGLTLSARLDLIPCLTGAVST